MAFKHLFKRFTASGIVQIGLVRCIIQSFQHTFNKGVIMTVSRIETRLLSIDLKPLELFFKVLYGIRKQTPLRSDLLASSHPFCLNIVTVAVLHARPKVLKGGMKLKFNIEKMPEPS